MHILEVTLSNVKGQWFSRGQDVLLMSCGYQTWSTEPLPKVHCIAVVKTHLRVSLGQPDVKLLRNALWLPNSVVRNYDQSVMHSGVKKHAGVSQEIARKSPIAPNFFIKNIYPECDNQRANA